MVKICYGVWCKTKHRAAWQGMKDWNGLCSKHENNNETEKAFPKGLDLKHSRCFSSLLLMLWRWGSEKAQIASRTADYIMSAFCLWNTHWAGVVNSQCTVHMCCVGVSTLCLCVYLFVHNVCLSACVCICEDVGGWLRQQVNHFRQTHTHTHTVGCQG